MFSVNIKQPARRLIPEGYFLYTLNLVHLLSYRQLLKSPFYSIFRYL
nr:MAG TPA: hypothetical protein [Caudoviricetes sp.]